VSHIDDFFELAGSKPTDEVEGAPAKPTALRALWCGRPLNHVELEAKYGGVQTITQVTFEDEDADHDEWGGA
jgi:hypothetical protein